MRLFLALLFVAALAAGWLLSGESDPSPSLGDVGARDVEPGELADDVPDAAALERDQVRTGVSRETDGASDGDGPLWLYGTAREENTQTPIPGAEIRIFGQSEWQLNEEPPPVLLATAKTDSAGSFRFEMPELRSAHLPWREWSFTAVVTAHDFAGRGVVHEGSNRADGVEFEIELERGRALRCRAVSVRGEPVGGAIFGLRLGDEPERMVAGDDGFIEFLIDDDWVEQAPEWQLVCSHPDHGVSEVRTVAVGGRGTIDVGDLVMHRTTAEIRGVVRFEDGAPVDGLRLVLRSLGDVSKDWSGAAHVRADGSVVEAEVVTDAAGRFSIQNAAVGRYALNVHEDGLPGLGDGAEFLGDPWRELQTNQPVELTMPLHRLDVDVRLPGGGEATYAEVQFHGWKADAAHLAQAAFEDGAQLPMDKAWIVDYGNLVGDYRRIWMLPERFHVLHVFARGYDVGPWSGTTSTPSRVHVMRRVAKPLGATSKVRITLSNDQGEPIPHYLWRSGRRFATYTAWQRGDWFDERTVPRFGPGSWRLEFRPGVKLGHTEPRRYLNAAADVEVLARNVAEARVVVPRASQVRLQLIDADPTLQPRADLTSPGQKNPPTAILYRHEGQPWQYGVRGVDDPIEIAFRGPLPPGHYELTLRGRSRQRPYAPFQTAFDVPDSAGLVTIPVRMVPQ